VHDAGRPHQSRSTFQPERHVESGIPDVGKLGRSIIDLHIAACGVEQASERVCILEKHLSNELDTINSLIKDLQSDAYQPSPDLTKQTIDYQRKTKALASKLPELRDRVTSLAASLGNRKVTIQDVKAEEEKFKSLLSIVKDLEVQVKSYHGLPQDTDLARLELEGVRVELQDLRHQRDSMFEALWKGKRQGGVDHEEKLGPLNRVHARV